MSANSNPGSKGSRNDVRGNPLFANTSDEREKRKIRPPAYNPAAKSAEQTLPLEETPQPEMEIHTGVNEKMPMSSTAQRRPPPPREMGEVRFDEFYIKKTMHFIPALLEQFDALARKQHKSKTRLFNEAIASILASYNALDEETRAVLKEFGIEVHV